MTVAVEAKATSIGRIPLLVLAAVLWSVGWLAAKVSLAALWIAAAVGLGWSDGHTSLRRD